MAESGAAEKKAKSAAAGQRQTRQREAIARVIDAVAGPLMAREIHLRAQAEAPALGIATVYRALKRLMEAREIQSVVLSSGEPRYESVGRGHHDHVRAARASKSSTSLTALLGCRAGLHCRAASWSSTTR